MCVEISRKTTASNAYTHMFMPGHAHMTRLVAMVLKRRGFVKFVHSDSTAQVPPYVGRDYYCETGNNGDRGQEGLFPNDPLWDGQQCVGVEAPCCTRPNMPWFIKTLGETTTEDIQLRLCVDGSDSTEETLYCS